MLVFIEQKKKTTEFGSTLSNITGINIDLGIDFSFIDNITKEIGRGLNNVTDTIAKAHIDTLKEAGRGATNVVNTVKKAGKDIGVQAQRSREDFARSDIGRSDIGRVAGDVIMMGVGVGTEIINIQAGVAQGTIDATVSTGTGIIGGTAQLLKGESRGAETIYKASIAGAEKLYKTAFVEPMEKYVLNFYLALPDPTDLGPLGKVSRDDMFGIAITVASVVATVFFPGGGTAAVQAGALAAKQVVKQTLIQTMKTWVANHFTAAAAKALGKKALMELVKQKSIELLTAAISKPVVMYNLDKAQAEHNAKMIAAEAAFALFCDEYDCSKPLRTTDPEQLWFERECRGYKCKGVTQTQIPTQTQIRPDVTPIVEDKRPEVRTRYTDPKLPYILGGVGLIAAFTLFGGD